MKGDANFDRHIWVDKGEVKSGSSLFLWGKWDHDSSVTVSWLWKCPHINTLLKKEFWRVEEERCSAFNYGTTWSEIIYSLTWDSSETRQNDPSWSFWSHDMIFISRWSLSQVVMDLFWFTGCRLWLQASHWLDIWAGILPPFRHLQVIAFKIPLATGHNNNNNNLQAHAENDKFWWRSGSCKIVLSK